MSLIFRKIIDFIIKKTKICETPTFPISYTTQKVRCWTRLVWKRREKKKKNTTQSPSSYRTVISMKNSWAGRKTLNNHIWRRHNCRWRAAKFKPMLGAQGLWARGIFLVSHLLWRGTSVFPDSPIQSPLSTRKGMLRTYSNLDPHG
jgi:hypothetical protein